MDKRSFKTFRNSTFARLLKIIESEPWWITSYCFATEARRYQLSEWNTALTVCPGYVELNLSGAPYIRLGITTAEFQQIVSMLPKMECLKE